MNSHTLLTICFEKRSAQGLCRNKSAPSIYRINEERHTQTYRG